METKIVIIEDNPYDSELMIRTFKKNNLANNLIVLEDGQEALDFMFCTSKYTERDKTKLPSVIFLDLKLPKINGLQVLKELKTNNKTKHVPIVVISSSNQSSDIKTAYNYGANSYVVKPIDYDEFIKTVNNLGLYWLIINKINTYK